MRERVCFNACAIKTTTTTTNIKEKLTAEKNSKCCGMSVSIQLVDYSLAGHPTNTNSVHTRTPPELCVLIRQTHVLTNKYLLGLFKCIYWHCSDIIWHLLTLENNRKILKYAISRSSAYRAIVVLLFWRELAELSNVI